jgi:hypothetical protein
MTKGGDLCHLARVMLSKELFAFKKSEFWRLK